MRIASATLAPTDANLLPDYASFVEYRRACDAFCERVNARSHHVTRCPPVEVFDFIQHLNIIDPVTVQGPDGPNKPVGTGSVCVHGVHPGHRTVTWHQGSTRA